MRKTDTARLDASTTHDVLEQLRGSRSRITGGVIIVGFLSFSAIGAIVGGIISPRDSQGLIAGGFIGLMVGFFPTLLLAAIAELVLNWLYHSLWIQNKMLELALRRDAASSPQNFANKVNTYDPL